MAQSHQTCPSEVSLEFLVFTCLIYLIIKSQETRWTGFWFIPNRFYVNSFYISTQDPCIKEYKMYFFKAILRRIKIHEVVSMRIAKNLMYGYVFPIFFSATCTDFSMVKMPPRNIWIRLFSCALQTTTILHCLYCAKLSAQIIKCIELWEFSTHPLKQNKHKLPCGLGQQQSWLRQGIQ